MAEVITHPTKKWEISLIKLEERAEVQYKVTRRLPTLAVAETKMFSTLEAAKK